ncbi:MAG: PilN domain-containing protein, partial [Synechococcus sp.]|nr:PilN domain-containing protein [Synechococcus sp.]
MSAQLDLAAGLDLLRERRRELGLAEPQELLARQRGQLVRGCGWAMLLVGGVALLGVLLTVRAQSVLASLDREALVEAKVAELEQALNGRNKSLEQLSSANRNLASALVAIRSGSALMRDLQLRVPQGVRLREVKILADSLEIKGEARDPLSFARINALQLQLARSPLLDPQGVVLTQAERIRGEATQAMGTNQVGFQL